MGELTNAIDQERCARPGAPAAARAGGVRANGRRWLAEPFGTVPSFGTVLSFGTAEPATARTTSKRYAPFAHHALPGPHPPCHPVGTA